MAENEKDPASASDEVFRQTPPGIQPISASRRQRPADLEEEAGEQQDKRLKLDSLNQKVQTLSSQIKAVSALSESLASPAKPLRRWKKIVRQGAANVAEESTDPAAAPASAGSIASALLTAPTALLDAGPEVAKGEPVEPPAPDKPPLALGKPKFAPARATAQRARRSTSRTKRRSPIIWIACQAFGFALVLVGFLLGRMSSGPDDGASQSVATDSLGEGSTTESAASAEPILRRASAVLLASKNGNPDEARRLIEEAQSKRPGLPESDYRMALLALQSKNQSAARQWLDRAIANRQNTAASYYLCALLEGERANFTAAAGQLELAARAEPFNARYLFFWGESLRRAGKPHAAIEMIGQALLRPSNSADAELMAYKARLARIEAGSAGDLAAETSEKLKSDPASGLWTLTAAAQEIQRGDFAAAAKFLQRATRTLSAEDFNQQMRDYFFATHTLHKEIAPFLTRGASAQNPWPTASPALLDPLAWTLPQADPASWQVLPGAPKSR